MDNSLLFTYGTLRVGQYNASLISDTGSYIETVKSVKLFIMVTNDINSFPFLIDPEHWPEMRHMAVQIIGDIYTVNPKGISRCDHLEGHPTWYCRNTIDVINNENVELTSSSSCLIPNQNKDGYLLNIRYVNYEITDKGNYLKCDKHIITNNKYLELDKEF
jgi:gamma-glutamylcyclotransferase (GGCT)/AIG2-like uncharacterized protein YtfP